MCRHRLVPSIANLFSFPGFVFRFFLDYLVVDVGFINLKQLNDDRECLTFPRLATHPTES